MSNLVLHLLDAAMGHPVQTWDFSDRERVTIGRGSENDIPLADTQVSRHHVELFLRNDLWLLSSKGRNGTQIHGDWINEDYRLTDETIFQLGPSGPTFRCEILDEDDKPSSPSIYQATLDPGAAGLDHLIIDSERQTEEVNLIADSEAFKVLQEQAKKFKDTQS